MVKHMLLKIILICSLNLWTVFIVVFDVEAVKLVIPERLNYILQTWRYFTKANMDVKQAKHSHNMDTSWCTSSAECESVD